ncbi:hypothetical protein [Mesorhizobium jarvisii]|uniref:hypothetical protein n=1 Tax=Mesorhizobium jarvisii TaxID=1777867 RepID=UPI000B33674A|nr:MULTISPECIES: hypothetical protein [Mesorhizobium]
MNITGYAAILGLIIAMGAGLVAYHYKVEARDAVAAQQAAERSLKTALDVNADNEKTMTAQAAENVRVDKLAGDLADEVEAANNSTLNMAKALADLRAKNADVDAYLRLPIPDAIRGLYGNPKAAGGH